MDKFTRMILGAKRADVDSIRELKNYIYEESGVANKALRALEKSGITEYAYGHAMTFLQTEYQSIKFPQAVAKRPVDDLIKQAYALHKFMKSPTHKVREAKKARERQLRGLEMLRDMGYNIPTDKDRLARITRILGNSGVNFIGSYKYEIMELIDSTYDADVTDAEVQLQIDRYASGMITYDRVTEDLRALGR